MCFCIKKIFFEIYIVFNFLKQGENPPKSAGFRRISDSPNPRIWDLQIRENPQIRGFQIRENPDSPNPRIWDLQIRENPQIRRISNPLKSGLPKSGGFQI